MSFSTTVIYEKDDVLIRVGVNPRGELNIEKISDNESEEYDIYLPPYAHEELFNYLRHK